MEGKTCGPWCPAGTHQGCPQGDPEPHQPHVGYGTGQQGWKPPGLCSLGPEGPLRFRVQAPTLSPQSLSTLSPRCPTGLTELSCHSLQSQPQLVWGSLSSSTTCPSHSTPNPASPPVGPSVSPPSFHHHSTILVSSQSPAGSAERALPPAGCDLGQVPGPLGPFPSLEPEDTDS